MKKFDDSIATSAKLIVVCWIWYFIGAFAGYVDDFRWWHFLIVAGAIMLGFVAHDHWYRPGLFRDYEEWRNENPPVAKELVELGEDPLDPRGDGTLRPGDPLFDMIMDRIEDGKTDGVFVANRNDTNPSVWEVESRNLTEKERRSLEEGDDE